MKLKFKQEFNLDRPILQDRVSRSLANRLQEWNYIVLKEANNCYSFSVKGGLKTINYKANKFYNQYFRDGSFNLKSNNSNLVVIWSISISYLAMYFLGVFIGTFVLFTVYSSALIGLFLGFLLSFVVFVILRLKIINWLKRLSNSVIDNYL